MASAGLPKKPVMKRMARTVLMLAAVTIGIWKTTKRRRVAMYTGLRPSAGSSWRGERNMGPIP